MDTVRLGRVLGMGARHAAKTLMEAADAAAAEAPAKKAGPRPVPEVLTPAARGVAAGRQARSVATGARRGSKSFGESVWSPFKRLSGVLWLEVTGVFFGLFAMVGIGAVWTHRQYVQAGATALQHRSFAMYCVVALLFSYFTVSSFVRASRRGRRR